MSNKLDADFFRNLTKKKNKEKRYRPVNQALLRIKKMADRGLGKVVINLLGRERAYFVREELEKLGFNVWIGDSHIGLLGEWFSLTVSW